MILHTSCKLRAPNWNESISRLTSIEVSGVSAYVALPNSRIGCDPRARCQCAAYFSTSRNSGPSTCASSELRLVTSGAAYSRVPRWDWQSDIPLVTASAASDGSVWGRVLDDPE